MSSTAQVLTPPAVLESLHRYLDPPQWLAAAARPELVRAALEREVPELAAGSLVIRDLSVKRLRLKRGPEGWIGQYELSFARPDEPEARTTLLAARVIPPGFAEPAAEGSAPLGSDGWGCYLSDLRLELRALPEDPALPALRVLGDPAQARELLERSIRAGFAPYHDIQIASCAIQAMRYKPGSRATVVYRLGYAEADQSRGWPGVVVAKTYSGGKGQNAFDSMQALWSSPLSSGDVVTLAPPLAYLPELKVLVQGPIPEEQTLEDLLKSALRSGAPEAMDELRESMLKTARGLAALHGSGIAYGETITWEEELAEVREVAGRLAAPLPQLADAAEPLLTRLEALAAGSRPDPVRPSHRAFRPAQVLLHQGRIGFIDFDGFGQAEPALDLSRFLRKTRALGLDALKARGEGDEASHQVQLDALCELFLAEYERHAPVSRPRIALWETLDLLTLVLYCWTKIEPERLRDNMFLLERHLRVSALL